MLPNKDLRIKSDKIAHLVFQCVIYVFISDSYFCKSLTNGPRILEYNYTRTGQDKQFGPPTFGMVLVHAQEYEYQQESCRQLAAVLHHHYFKEAWFDPPDNEFLYCS